MIQLNPNWRRLPRGLPQALSQWVDSRPEATFYDLWDETINPTWLPYLADAGGATKKQLVFAGCAVARLCLHLLPDCILQARNALETAEAWCKGEATEEQVKEAKNAAYSRPYCTMSAHYALNGGTIYAATYWAVEAGIESQLVCSTVRKHLVFERPPRPKKLTIWQRLVIEDP